MSRIFWSLLFCLVPILAIGAYALAAAGMWPFEGAWLPELYSAEGGTIDHLFYLIHYIAAGILILTGLGLAWVVFRYDASRVARARYLHESLKLELLWSLIPAAILVFIALYQMNAWATHKMNRPRLGSGPAAPELPPSVRVVGRQFGWEFHYAGPDGRVETEDDLYIENELVLPVGEEIVLQLESRDVIHSFFVPELRVKQDMVPGMVQYVWFRATRPGEMEIACTELCGWGHFRMKAALRFVPAEEYEAWLDDLAAGYRPSRLAQPAVDEGENDG